MELIEAWLVAPWGMGKIMLPLLFLSPLLLGVLIWAMESLPAKNKGRDRW